MTPPGGRRHWVIELEGVPELVDPVMVAAFEGWNDAGDAASAAVGHLDREWKGEVFAALDAEDYYDFQVNRPTVFLDGGERKVTWPTTRLSVVRVGGEKPRDLVLVRGIEPSMRWRSFCNEILAFAHELGVEMVVILGALLGDTPHTRPVPVNGVTSDPQLARTMDLEETRYEGPTGIVGILQEACTHAGVPAVSLWAAVPHYVSQPPNPKATLALLNRLEDLIGARIPLGELAEDARAWQLGVDQLAAEDSEVSEYVQSLEEARDTAELPEATGEAIALEFERYLRRRDGHPGPGQPGGHATGTAGGPEGRDSGSYLRDTSSGRSRPPKPPARQERDDRDAARAEAGAEEPTADGEAGTAGPAAPEETTSAPEPESEPESESATEPKPESEPEPESATEPGTAESGSGPESASGDADAGAPGAAPDQRDEHDEHDRNDKHKDE